MLQTFNFNFFPTKCQLSSTLFRVVNTTLNELSITVTLFLGNEIDEFQQFETNFDGTASFTGKYVSIIVTESFYNSIGRMN